MAGGAAAASGSAALSQMPCENAAKLPASPDQQHGRDRAAGRSRCAATPASPPATASAPPPARRRRARVERSRTDARRRSSNGAIAVAMISTPGMTGSNGVEKTSPPPVTVAPMTTIWSRTASGGTVAVQQRGRADGRGSCRGGRRRPAAAHDRCRSESAAPQASGRRVWMAGSVPVASAATRNGNDSSTLSAVRNSIGNAARRARIVRGQIDHAGRGMIGECLERQQEFFGLRQSRQRRHSRLHRPTASRSGKTAAAAITLGRLLERRRQRRIAGRHCRDRAAAGRLRRRAAPSGRSLRRCAASSARGSG